MPFIDYTVINWCRPCDYRFFKNIGVYCPKCKRRARTAPRVPAKTGKDLRMRVPN